MQGSNASKDESEKDSGWRENQGACLFQFVDPNATIRVSPWEEFSELLEGKPTTFKTWCKKGIELK